MNKKNINIKIDGKVCREDFHDQDNKKITNDYFIFNSSCSDSYVDVIKNYIASRMK